MMQEKIQVTSLSRNVLKMKFMQKTLDEDARRELENDGDSSLAAQERWSLKITPYPEKKSKYGYFTDYKTCLKLQYGRMSFGGFNKPLEKLLMEAGPEDQDSDEGKVIGDVEMAEHFSSINSTVANKFKKRKSNQMTNTDSDDDVSEVKKRKVSDDSRVDEATNTKPKFLKPLL